VQQAITWAVDRWDTDIISMSFGRDESSSSIRVAAEHAMGKNKILVAAVGNHGSDKPISYPAREKDVFKIFATSFGGAKVPFSPATPYDDTSRCFAIPGEQIVSIWPSKCRQRAGREQLDFFCWDPNKLEPSLSCQHPEASCDWRTVMSGTSFATPLVAALVAVIYQFYDLNVGSQDSAVKLKRGSEDRFKTPAAVQAILREMSRKSPDRPDNYLVPGSGRNESLYFRRDKEASERVQKTVNLHGETQVRFFARRISEILESAGV
jgi:subtilisin family serine protease